jgi:hypothetical protein
MREDHDLRDGVKKTKAVAQGQEPHMSEYVELSLPAQPELLHLVRFHVAAAASLLDWPVDEVDDLRLATDELCQSLLRSPGPPDQRLEITLTWDPQTIEVRCGVAPPVPRLDRSADGRPPGSKLSGAPSSALSGLPGELSERVLTALVDEHGTYIDDGRVVAWLRKRLVSVGHRP